MVREIIEHGDGMKTTIGDLCLINRIREEFSDLIRKILCDNYEIGVTINLTRTPQGDKFEIKHRGLPLAVVAEYQRLAETALEGVIRADPGKQGVTVETTYTHSEFDPFGIKRIKRYLTD
ncbi:MAG: hypothetical protein ABIA78_01495 [archaeon]